MASQLLTLTRRFALGGASGLTGLAVYKSRTDPIHIFWDLDHTILCSISPIPDIDDQENDNPELIKQTSKCPVSPSNLAQSLPSCPTLYHFDQIDDDFPYRGEVPNTRTFIRPGAQMALKLCHIFGIIHVYTAAQGSYTNNILKELDPDRTLFTGIIHRCDYPEIVQRGKDLNVGKVDLRRAILFDDKPSNFKPQKYENGIVVKKFTDDRVAKCNGGNWSAYLEEVKEMSRLVGLAFWSSIHLSGDVRNVVSYVRNWNDTKPDTKQ